MSQRSTQISQAIERQKRSRAALAKQRAGSKDVPAGQDRSTVPPEDRPLLTVNARAAALAWINSFLAASKDPERPLLYRNLSLEFFETGLHFIGCDGTALFRTWVASTEARDWPDLDEASTAKVLVMDPDAFGVSWMKALLQVTGHESHQHEQLVVTTMSADDGETPALGQAFQTERLVLRACGQRLDLRLHEGTYPDWRTLQLGMTPHERMDGLTVSPRILAMVGKLKGVGAVDLLFRGTSEKAIDFEARETPFSDGILVRGLMMPMRRPEKKKAAESDQFEEDLDEE